MPNLASAGSEFGEIPIPFSELRTCQGSEFGERTGPNLGSAGSEKGLLLSPNSEPWNVRSSEKGPGRTKRFGRFGVRRKARYFLRTPNPGMFGGRRKDWAEPWLRRFRVRRKEHVQQVLAFLKEATASLFRNAGQGK